MSADESKNGTENGNDNDNSSDVIDVGYITMPVEEGTYTAYSAVVNSVHDGFCFLGSVRRGTESIATNGDVFCPNDRFEVGDYVSFDLLNVDREKPGRFRTETATKIVASEIVFSENGPVNAMVLRKAFESAKVAYHNNAKPVSDEDKLQALMNVPFDQMLLSLAQAVNAGDMPISEYAEQMLSDQAFPELASFDVSSSIAGDVDEEAEAERINEIADDYDSEGMDSTSLRDQYRRFAGARKVFELMQANGILHLDTIIPMRYLPEIAVACPVWYMEGLSVDGINSAPNQIGDSDPLPSMATRFVCDQVGTKEFAWFFQLYNRRTRPLSLFKGKDLMPPKIMKILKQARKTFDYVAILTPYHDEASQEWQDPEWLRNIDPFLVGFNKDVPFFFILGRWSGTGIFPLFLDMTADTMAHLRSHKHLLSNFGSSSYWYRGERNPGETAEDKKKNLETGGTYLGNSSNGNSLVNFAGQVLEAYDAGRLFKFLRGEKDEVLPASSNN